MGFFSKLYNTRASMADLIALAAYTAVRNCGGPKLVMKAGRIDATGSALEGRVPEPREPTATLIQKFANAGFNQREMIQATLGGVHREDFPEIARKDFSEFDSTENKFDNQIATEYLDGTTKNPLVLAPGGNNSDFKVFNSDGNSTIRAMSTPQSFTSNCESILQRMIDTVPASVRLSAPLTPLVVKPHLIQLQLLKTDTLQLSGYIRVMDQGTGIPSVKLVYKDRDGKIAPSPIGTQLKGTGKGLEASLRFFEISSNTLVNGISSFDISVTSAPGAQTVYKNNGGGYPIQDNIILQQTQSCLSQRGDNAGNKNLTLTAAVKSNLGSTAPQMGVVIKSSVPGSLVPRLSTASSPMRLWRNTTFGYTLYSASYSLPTSSWSTTVDVWAQGTDGARFEDAFRSTSSLPNTCGPF